AKSRITSTLLFLLVFTISAPIGSFCQTQDEPVRIGINLVTLDVAVTDKHRRPVRNLTAKDFTIFENDVPQKIESFSSFAPSARNEQKPRTNQKEIEVQPPDRQPASGTRRFSGDRFSSIAIDTSTVEAANRDNVERAIIRYMRQQLQPDDLVAVYSIGHSLALTHPFTGDRAKLLKAAAGAVRGQIATDAATTREEASKEIARASQSLDTGSPQEQADRASRAVFESYNAVSDYFQAQSLFRSLRAIIDVQPDLTGSKSLILFSQGATIAPSSGYAVDGVIAAANAAGVSVYAIDAGGLSVGEAPRGIDPRGNLGLPSKQRPDIYGGEDPTKVRDGENGLERALKRTLASSQPDRIGVLARLSEQTGGISVTNNNDLSSGLEMIDTDLRAHYTVAYIPANQTFDGRFRQITVKVTNPELSVRTRKGYYAVKSEAAITEDAPVRKLASDILAGVT